MTTSLAGLPALPIAAPLLAAAIIAGLRHWLSRAAADALGLIAAALNLVLCLLLFHTSLASTIVYWMGGWYPRGHLAIGIGLVIDPTGAGMATLASFLMLLALCFSCRSDVGAANHFHPLMLVFLAAACGFSLTGDVFNMFVFFELLSTAAFALCGLATGEAAPLQGAFNFAVTNTIAAFLILIGIGILSSLTGALNLAQMGEALGSRHDAVVLFAAAVMMCGFLIKAAIVPFHFWLPDAHSVAPTPVCAIFSGVMVELGLYAIVRIHSIVFAAAFAPHATAFRSILLGLSVATVLLAGIMCYAQHHLKRILAFATVTHMGLVLAAMALDSVLGVAGMLLYVLGYALVSASLFFTSGVLLHRVRTISERRLFGRGRALPFTALLWFVGALALAGVPLFPTFTGRLFVGQAARSLGLDWLPWLFVVGATMTSAALLRSGVRTFLGWGDPPISDRSGEIEEIPETEHEDRRVLWNQFTPATLCLMLAAAVALSPAVSTGTLHAAARLLNGNGYVHQVFREAPVPSTVPVLPSHKGAASMLRGLLVPALAALLAATSIFRLRLPRWLRIGAFLEGPLPALRALQSGHPGDYVMWLTVGTSCVALLCMVFLR
jgi:multicomponent Na+:H+ antiporter subunit D